MKCPGCGSERLKKNGTIHNKKQKYQCNDCRRQFVENSQNKKISPAKRERVNARLLEKISLAGIIRTVLVSKSGLPHDANRLYAEIPRHVKVLDKSKGRLTIECDELVSLVGARKDKAWTWLAKDTLTGEIAGHDTGVRDKSAARKRWDSLPPVYRQGAVCYTDFGRLLKMLFPPKDIKRPVKKPDLPTLLSVSTTHLDNVYRV